MKFAKTTRWGLLVFLGLVMLFVGLKLVESPSEDSRSGAVVAEQEKAPASQIESGTGGNPEDVSSSQWSKETSESRVKLFGTVTFADTGQAVADAEVLINHPFSWAGENLQRSVSNEQGRFELIVEKPSELILSARKDNYISYESLDDVNEISIAKEDISVGPIQLKLYPGSMLKIRVVSNTDGRLLPGATVKTLAKPRVTFEDDHNGILHIPLSKEIVSLMVRAPGHEMKQVNVNLGQEFKEAIEVELSPGGRIFGTVRDQEGLPVEKAQVVIDFLKMQAIAESDVKGSFELDHLPLKRELFLRAIKKDVGFTFVEMTLDSTVERQVDLVLMPQETQPKSKLTPCEVEGFVVDIDDQPLENALVSFDPSGRGRNPVEVRTNHEGFFRIQVLNYGGFRQTIQISKPGYAFQYVKYEAHQNQAYKVKVVLEKGHFLEGRVISKMGDPVPDAKLFMRIPEARVNQAQKQVVTDHQGFFRMDDLPSQIEVTIRADGFSPFIKKSPVLDRSDAEFVIQGLGRLQGKVVYKETGEPVTSYKIFLQKMNPRYQGYFSSSDDQFPGGLWIQTPDGGFLFDHFDVGKHFNISIEADGYGLDEPQEVVVVPPGEETPLLLEIEPFRDSYEGLVMTTADVPLADVTVTLVCSSTKQLFQARQGQLSMSGGMGVTYQSSQRTDASGRFVFEGVPDNSFVFLECDKEGFATVLRDNLTLLKDAEKKALSIKLFREAKMLVVVEKDSLPQDTDLSVTNRKKYYSQHENIKAGVEIEIGKLSPGEYRLRVQGPYLGDNRPSFSLKKSVSLAEGETRRVVLTDEEKRRLSGTAHVAGELAANRQLALQLMQGHNSNLSQGFGQRVVATDDAGYFEFEEVAAGPYKLMLLSRQSQWSRYAVATRMRTSNNAVRVTVADEDVNQTFTFQKHTKVRGRLLNGAGIGSVLLSRHPYLAAAGYQTVVDLDHSFQLLDVEPGVFSLHLLRSQPAIPNLVLRDIVIPEDGSDLDLGDVEAEPVGRLRLTLNQTWIPKTLHRMTFVIYGSEEALSPQSLRSLPTHTWSDIQVPKLISGLPEGKYKFAMLEFSGGFISQPMNPGFEIHEGETKDLLITLQPVTFLRGNISLGMEVTSAEMIHQQSGQTMTFEMRESRDLREVYLQTPTYAFVAGNALVTGGIAEGTWRLRVLFKDGRLFDKNVTLSPGEVVRMDLTPD